MRPGLLSRNGKISSLDDARRWQSSFMAISSDSFELRLFRSWLDRYAAHTSEDVRPASRVESTAKKVGALVVPFVVRDEQFYEASSFNADAQAGVGWIVGHQSVHSDSSGQRPAAWVMGCELHETDHSAALSGVAINGLVSVFEGHTLGARGRLLYLTKALSGVLNESLASAGFNSSGSLGGVHAVADKASGSVDLIPDSSPVNAYIFEKKIIDK